VRHERRDGLTERRAMYSSASLCAASRSGLSLRHPSGPITMTTRLRSLFMISAFVCFLLVSVAVVGTPRHWGTVQTHRSFCNVLF
jgi:hypothetical protein